MCERLRLFLGQHRSCLRSDSMGEEKSKKMTEEFKSIPPSPLLTTKHLSQRKGFSFLQRFQQQRHSILRSFIYKLLYFVAGHWFTPYYCFEFLGFT